MKVRLTALLIIALAPIASAHPGHGDIVHRAIGIDWSIAALMVAIGSATLFAGRGIAARVLGGIMACGGLAFAASLV